MESVWCVKNEIVGLNDSCTIFSLFTFRALLERKRGWEGAEQSRKQGTQPYSHFFKYRSFSLIACAVTFK